MHFVVIVLGLIVGASMGAGSAGFLGAGAGALIASLLFQLGKSKADQLKLSRRIDAIEARQAAIRVGDSPTEEAGAAAETPVAEKPETPAVPEESPYIGTPPVAAKTMPPPKRVSIYEPEETPTPEPQTAAMQEETEESEEAEEAVRQRTPVTPQGPSTIEHLVDVAKRWLTTGNVPVKVGVFISFIGVSFLLKYAIENSILNIPISVRYMFVALFAGVLMWLGWRMRESNRVYALSLQGGGIGILFLTVFAAFQLHGLLSPGFAFSILVALTAATGYLAVKQESRALAILGTTGGFLAPLLVSTGSGNHVALFSYYLVLNGAVLGIAWVRAWRELNIIGFVFTFGVGAIWGLQYYVPEKFASTEPFLVLFFVFYTAIAILFAFKSKPQLRGYVDGTLVFGTPTIAFALQSQMLKDSEYGLSISAAIVAAFYAGLAVWLWKRKDERFNLLRQSFTALGVAFGTIAVPLALDDRWTAIAWALEGAALVWIGVRQSTSLAKLSGILLSFGSGVSFLKYGWIDDLGIPVLNGNFIGAALIGLAALYSAWVLLDNERDRKWQELSSVALMFWGLAWWFGAGVSEIVDRAAPEHQQMAGIFFFAASFGALLYGARRLQWTILRDVTRGLLPFLGGSGLIAYGWTNDLGIPVLNGNVIGGVLIAWISLYSSRSLGSDERAASNSSLSTLSVGLLAWGLLFWFGTGSWEILDRVSGTNQLHALLLFGSLSLAAIAYAGTRFDWLAYRRVSLALLPMLAIGAFLYLIEHDHFLEGLGVLAWIVAVAAHFWVLRAYGDRENIFLWHVGGALLLTAITAYETFWQIDEAVINEVWAFTGSMAVIGVTVFLLLRQRDSRRWPFATQFSAYAFAALVLATSYMFFVIVACIGDPGSPSPLPFVPILNPLDLLSIGGLALTLSIMRGENESLSNLSDRNRAMLILWGGSAFVLATLSVMRVVHHYAGVPWDSEAMMDSVVLQTSLTIFWAALGLTGMLLGTRRANRNIWLIGVGLMTIVVLKLMVVDLSNTGTVARIVSFLGVGVMLLVVGYFSPVPPRLEEPDAGSSE